MVFITAVGSKLGWRLLQWSPAGQTDMPVLFWGVTVVLGSLVWKSCCGSELSELFCGNMGGGLTCEGEPLRITVVCGTF